MIDLEAARLVQFSEQVIYCQSFRIALLISSILFLRKSNNKITGISDPLTKWIKVIKGQVMPAFFVSFFSQEKKKFQIMLKSNKDTELHCYLFLLKVSLQQAWHPGSNSILFRDCI